MIQPSDYVKIRVVVPTAEADKIREVLGCEGAGVQGKYQYCSFSYPVTGRFLPMEGATPAVGEVGKLETVEEEVVETICHKDLVAKVVAAVKQAHLYEEPAIDVMPRFEFG